MLNRRNVLASVALAPVLAAPIGWAHNVEAQAATPRVDPGTIEREAAVVYGTVDGQELLLDIVRPPARQEPRPAIILLHGGGWMIGTANRTDRFVAEPAEALAEDGYVTFNVDYRLTGSQASEHLWPDQLDDVQRAVRWVRKNAGRYGVDLNRIGAYGHSAGGHLAAHLGVRETRDNSDPDLANHSSRVNAVVMIAGQSQLNMPYADSFARQAVVTLLGGLPDEAPDAYRDASPITWVDAQSAPFLIIHGGADTMIPAAHARHMSESLREVGVAVVSVDSPSGDHFSVAEWAVAGPWTRAFFALMLQPEH